MQHPVVIARSPANDTDVPEHADWGSRSPRWAGVRSEYVPVGGTRAHVLLADATRQAPRDATPHLLIHPMAAAATMWLDVLPALAAHGPVLAPDLPGGVVGRTAAPHPRAVRPAPSARFLRALLDTLGVEKVVVHGWSFGGLVAVHLAGALGDRVEGLVLANPALPRPLSTAERLGWQTAGRLAVALGTGLTPALRLFGQSIVERKRKVAHEGFATGKLAVAGGDTSRVARENIELLLDDQLGELREHPERLATGVNALAAALGAQFIDRAPTQDLIDALTVPTLLMWGGQDPLVDRPAIDYLLAHQPTWELHTFPSAGHLLPWELPDAYAHTVALWQAATGG